jgi:hypothetical protein
VVLPIAVQIDVARARRLRPVQHRRKELSFHLSGRGGRLLVGWMGVCYRGGNARIWAYPCLCPIRVCALVFFGLPGHS